MLTAVNSVEEGDMSSYFVKDLRLAQAAKMCPDLHRPSKMSIIVRHLP